MQLGIADRNFMQCRLLTITTYVQCTYVFYAAIYLHINYVANVGVHFIYHCVTDNFIILKW